MKKKTKILFVLAQMVGGGAERVTINLLKILDREKFDIHLAFMSKEGPSFEYLPTDITLHDLNVSRTIYSIKRLRKTIDDVRPDILYSTLHRTHIVLYFSLLAIRYRPIVLMRSPNSPKLIIKNKDLSRFSKVLLDIAYRSSDIVIAQTPEMKNELIEYHRTDKDKVQFLLNPLDTEDIDCKIKDVQTPFDKNRINVVAAGRLAVQKGFDVLIESFSHIVAKNSHFVLHIIGEDLGEKERLLRMVNELSLEEHVNFLGYQSNPYKYFYFSDLFVLSSRWEGMPNAVIENLYLNKPVVSTRCIPFMSELIREGENGLLVDVDDSEQMAQAILGYKKIKTQSMNSFEFKMDANDFFSQIDLNM